MAVARRHSDDGFTLVEILCVLVILGLSAGLVLVSLPKADSPLSQEVQAFATTVNITARDSIIDGRPRALDISKTGFALFNYDTDWMKTTERSWPDFRRMSLVVDDQKIDFTARAKSKTQLLPLIFMEPTGNVTPFTLELESRDETFRVKTNAQGRVVVDDGS